MVTECHGWGKRKTRRPRDGLTLLAAQLTEFKLGREVRPKDGRGRRAFSSSWKSQRRIVLALARLSYRRIWGIVASLSHAQR
jgi:hypothetical protein